MTFEKEIEFPTMIGEITAISLEQNIYCKDESNMEGEFLLTGRYKQTEASRIEEDFSYKIPTEIHLLERVKPNTTQVDIVDFYYDVVEENKLNCHIECMVEGESLMEEEKEEVLEEERECDGESLEEKEEVSVTEEEASPLFLNMEEGQETYGTFVVYLMRQNETIESIIEKYSTTLEEVEKYNKIEEIGVGSKVIIPLINE